MPFGHSQECNQNFNIITYVEDPVTLWLGQLFIMVQEPIHTRPLIG